MVIDKLKKEVSVDVSEIAPKDNGFKKFKQTLQQLRDESYRIYIKIPLNSPGLSTRDTLFKYNIPFTKIQYI